MTIEIFSVQLLLAALLFFLLNWVGKHSYSIGYMEISVFIENETAPAFNFLIRVLGPVVFLLVVSALLYSLKMDRYVYNFYWVSIDYLVVRFLFNLLMGRANLLNWKRMVFHWVCIVSLSYVSYTRIISKKSNILPDFDSIANELWIIIIVYVFHVFNNLQLPQEQTRNRKERYWSQQYKSIRNRYGSVIKDLVQNQTLESLVYAIIIVENFNRPKFARVMENLLFLITKKPKTFGIMQVYSSELISDRESISLGIARIKDSWSQVNANIKTGQFSSKDDYTIQSFIIGQYNGGSKYLSEIYSLADFIKKTFYPNTTDSLLFS